MTDQKYVAVGTATETTITVTREAASTERSQGLVLAADHELRVGDVETTTLVLWADTSPEEVKITTGDAGDLRMWNVWRDGDLIQAWENDARLEVDDGGDDLSLACYDGHAGNEPAPVVRLSFDRARTQPSYD